MEFQKEDQPGHHEAQQHDDQNRRPVRRIMAGEAQAAGLAFLRNLQITGKQTALPTAGTAPAEGKAQWEARAACHGSARDGKVAERGTTPDIDIDEQEEPDDVNEMPIPGGRLETHMLFRREMPTPRPEEADEQETGADKNMKAVKPGGQIESRGIDAIGQLEGGGAIFKDLEAQEDDPQNYRQGDAGDEIGPVPLEQRVMGPGDGGAR